MMKGKMPNAGNKLVIETAPWTNGDAIRDMTDEELAEWLTACLWGEARDVPFLLSCTVDKWLDWLRQEVKTE